MEPPRTEPTMKRAIPFLALLPAILGTSCSVLKFGKKDDADANPYAYEDSGNGGYTAGNFYGDQTAAPGYSGQYAESANVVPFTENGSAGSGGASGASQGSGSYEDAYTTPTTRSTPKPAVKTAAARQPAAKTTPAKATAASTVARKIGRTSAGVASRTSGSAKAKSATSKVYVVKPGDNLFRISLAKNVSVKRLKQLNGLSSDTIRSGQRLVLN